jgi:hypothetical protein
MESYAKENSRMTWVKEKENTKWTSHSDKPIQTS